jgi:hypothetical protein
VSRFSEIVFSFLVVIFTVESASAADYNLKEGKPLTGISITGGTDTFNVWASNDKSYCCEVWSNLSDSSGTRFDTITSSDAAGFTSAERGYATPIMTRSATSGEKSRQCYTQTSATDGRALISFTMKVSSGSGTGTVTDGNIRCLETTLYGGFNTIVTDYNFIEVTSTMTSNVKDDGEVNVVVKGYGTSGSQVFSSSFALGAGKRNDVNVHLSAPSDFGPVVITHDGPPGAIRAVNAQYRITTGTDFEPALVVPFREGR